MPKSAWSPFPDLLWLRGGMSQRADGGMSWRSAPLADVVANRRRYFSKLHLDLAHVVAAEQTHGANIAVVDSHNAGRGAEDARSRLAATDGLLTAHPGIILATLHADCAPVFYADPARRVIALAHAGWRGILAGLPGLLLKKLVDTCNCKAGDIHIAVGPSISPAHYEISADLEKTFATRFGDKVISYKRGRPHLDLCAALADNLLKSGADPDNLRGRPPCTFSNPDYFSYRRDGPNCPSMLAWLVMLPPT